MTPHAPEGLSEENQALVVALFEYIPDWVKARPNQINRLLNAARSEPRSSSGTGESGEGWKTVPVEPSARQIADMMLFVTENDASSEDFAKVGAVLELLPPTGHPNARVVVAELIRDYRAMLAAAPSPDRSGGETAGRESGGGQAGAAELLPRPFCGGGAEIIEAEEAGDAAYAIQCQTRGCEASSRVGFVLGDPVEEQLIAAWNRRAPDEDLSQVIDMAEIGRFLVEGPYAHPGGDGYQQPYELTICWDWQQNKPNETGMGALRNQVASWYAEHREDGVVLPEMRLRDASRTSPAPSGQPTQDLTPEVERLREEARDLENRLRGRYAKGPIMPNGEPEFGWAVFTSMPDGSDFPAIYGDAADLVRRLRLALSPVAGSASGSESGEGS